jgi:hypothetical protein
VSLQLHRPDGKGSLEPRRVEDRNWRNQLASPRWGTSLRGGRLPEMRNSEMNPTSTLRSFAFWFVLGLITLGALVLGYGPLGLWELGVPAS